MAYVISHGRTCDGTTRRSFFSGPYPDHDAAKAALDQERNSHQDCIGKDWDLRIQEMPPCALTIVSQVHSEAFGTTMQGRTLYGNTFDLDEARSWLVELDQRLRAAGQGSTLIKIAVIDPTEDS